MSQTLRSVLKWFVLLAALPTVADVIKFSDSDGVPGGDIYGGSVAVAANTFLVGARHDSRNGTNSGHAYVYTRISAASVPTLQDRLFPAAPANGAQFGTSVALDPAGAGNLAAVGAPFADGTGAVYLFRRIGGNWSSEAAKVSGSVVGGQFGGGIGGVSLSGQTLVVGERHGNGAVAGAGAAYVYADDGTNLNLVATLTATDGEANDSFGVSVSVSGSVAAIGASTADGTGAVYIFEEFEGAWSQVVKLTPPSGSVGDTFGENVALLGNRLVVGARGDDSGGADAGAAYLYENTGGSWQLATKLVADDASAGDLFGRAVTIAGNSVLVGAYLADQGGVDAGALYVFDQLSGTWMQSDKIVPVDVQGGDEFAVSLAGSGSNAIAGARFDDNTDANQGAAYVVDIGNLGSGSGQSFSYSMGVRKDTYIQATNPTQSFGNEIQMVSGNSGPAISLVQFSPFAFPPGAIQGDARLRLFICCSGNIPTFNPGQIDIYRLQDSWDENWSWDQFTRQPLRPDGLPGELSELVASIPFDPSSLQYVDETGAVVGAFIELPIPGEVVEGWLRNSSSNSGLAIVHLQNNLRFAQYNWGAPGTATRVEPKLQFEMSLPSGVDDAAIGTSVSSIDVAGVTVGVTANSGLLRTYSYGPLDSGEAVAFKNVANALDNVAASGSTVTDPVFLSPTHPIDCPIETCTDTATAINFSFSRPVQGFGLTTLNLLTNMVSATSTVRLQGLDSNGLLIDEVIHTGPQGATGVALDFAVRGSSELIASAVLLISQNAASPPAVDQGFGLDDFSVELDIREDSLAVIYDLPSNTIAFSDFTGGSSIDGGRLAAAAHGRISGLADPGGEVMLMSASASPVLPTDVEFTVKNPAPLEDDSFGYSVALDGGFLAVGSPHLFNSNPGQAFVFDSNTGALLHELVSPDGSLANFGTSIRIAGDKVLVGAPPFLNIGPEFVGAIVVFDLATGNHLYTVYDPTPGPRKGFGFSIEADVENDRFLVSAQAGSADPGSAHLFELSTGALQRSFADPTPNSSNFGFAQTIALNASHVAVGDVRDGALGEFAGAVYLFDITDGSLVTTLYHPNAGPGAGGRALFFGAGIALDEQRLAVTSLSPSPVAVVYSSTDFAELQRINHPQPSLDAGFGGVLEIDAGRLFMPAPADNSKGLLVGRGYLFDLDPLTADPIVGFADDPSANSGNWSQAVAAAGGVIQTIDFESHPTTAALNSQFYASQGVEIVPQRQATVGVGPLSSGPPFNDPQDLEGEGLHDGSNRIQFAAHSQSVTVNFDRPLLGVGFNTIDLQNRNRNSGALPRLLESNSGIPDDVKRVTSNNPIALRAFSGPNASGRNLGVVYAEPGLLLRNHKYFIGLMSSSEEIRSIQFDLSHGDVIGLDDLVYAYRPTLFDRGNGMIYDSLLDVTWLQDANYAQTSGFDADGRLNWPGAVAWAENLSFGGFDDWRLPTTFQPDATCELQTDRGVFGVQGAGQGCELSELGSLANLRGINGVSEGPFINVASNLYWSGTEAAWEPLLAWNVDLRAEFLLQDVSLKDTSFVWAWAVRDGDVGDTPANDPPELVTPPSYGVTENGVLSALVDVSVVGYDPDGDPLKVRANTQPANGTLVCGGAPCEPGNTELVAGAFSYTPGADYVGPDSFEFYLCDLSVCSGPFTASITVSAQTLSFTSNLPDVGRSEDGASIVVDVGAAFGAPFTSVELAGVSNAGLFSDASVAGGVLTLVLAADQNGTADVSVLVSTPSGETVSDTFQVSVAAVDDPVVINEVANVTVFEDDDDLIIDLTQVFDDVDARTNGAAQNFTVSLGGGNPDVFSASAIDDDGTLTLGFAADRLGDAQVTLSMTDGTGATETTAFSVTVIPVSVAGIPGPNVNVIGPTLDDPLHYADLGFKQQNEVECGFAPANAQHLFCAFNDYRGADDEDNVGDSWQGVAMSRDGGLTWTSRLAPGWKAYPNPVLRELPDGSTDPARFAADPAVASVPGAMMLGFIASDRAEKGPGGMYLQRWFEQRSEAGQPWLPEATTLQIAAGDADNFVDKDDLLYVLDPAAPDVPLDVTLEGESASSTRTLPGGTLVASYTVFKAGPSGFEAGAGFDQFDYVPGPLDTQNGWQVTQGSVDVNVQNSVVNVGDGAVAVTPNAAGGITPVTITAPSSLQTPVVDDVLEVGFDFQISTSPAAYASYRVRLGQAQTLLAFELQGPTGAIAYGDLSTGLTDPFSFALDEWHRLSVQLDYTEQSASVFLDGVLIAAQLPFSTATPVSDFDGLSIERGQSFDPGLDTLYLDGVSVRSATASGAEVFTTVSNDYGENWSTPLKISGTDEVNQGVSLAAQGNSVLAVWRRFLPPGGDPSQTDAIMYALSNDRGVTWSAPQLVAEICPFDQPAANDRFRTNSFAKAVSDGNNFHVFWADRNFAASNGNIGDACTNGEARIVMSVLDGAWSAPAVLDDRPDLRGHQLFPDAFGAAGRVQVAWYDLRHDESDLFEPTVFDRFDDPFVLRHTIDVRAARVIDQVPRPSIQVTQYRQGIDASGNLIKLERSHPNSRLFRKGSTPFLGDYISVSAPAYRADGNGGWVSTQADGNVPPFFIAWADNRDVRGDVWGDLTAPTTYSPPGSLETEPDPEGEQIACEITDDRSLTREQNVYGTMLQPAFKISAPALSKPTDQIQRGYVVYVQNFTDRIRNYEARILNQPSDAPPAGTGGRASFLEFPRPPFNGGEAATAHQRAVCGTPTRRRGPHRLHQLARCEPGDRRGGGRAELRELPGCVTNPQRIGRCRRVC